MEWLEAVRTRMVRSVCTMVGFIDRSYSISENGPCLCVPCNVLQYVKRKGERLHPTAEQAVIESAEGYPIPCVRARCSPRPRRAMAPAPPRGRGMRSTGVCGGISICALNYACLVYRFGKTLLVFIRLCVRSQELCVLAAATCELRL